MSPTTWLLAISIIVATAAVLLILYIPRVGELFHQHVPDRPRRRLFLAAVGFFTTFTLARSLAFLASRNIGPFRYLYIGGTHVHHLVWGILLLLAVGFGWLIEVGTGSKSSSLLASRLMSLLYGVGAALTLDEFSIWLNVQEGVYWTRGPRQPRRRVAFRGLAANRPLGARLPQGHQPRASPLPPQEEIPFPCSRQRQDKLPALTVRNESLLLLPLNIALLYDLERRP